MSLYQITVSATLLLGCIALSGCPMVPSDDNLMEQLKAKQPALDALARLCEEDDASAVWSNGHGVEATKHISWDREKQYIELVGRAGVTGIRRTPSGILLFEVARSGIAGHIVEVGYAYSTAPPSMNPAPVSLGQQVFHAVQGNWYVYRGRS